MSSYDGPQIVTNGLVLCLDAGDLNSCGGQPVTNLLTYTDSFSSTWQGYCGPTSNITFNTTAVTDPLGTNTAVKIARNNSNGCFGVGDVAMGLLYGPAVPVLASGGTYTTSIYARGASGGESFVYGLNDTHGTGTTLTTTWTRYSTTFSNITNTDRGFQFYNSTATSQTYYVWGPQTVSGSATGPYAPSVATTNGTANLSWRDMSGGGYNASIYGPLLYSSERGGCYDFSGVAGAASNAATLGFSFASNMVPTTGNFTISTWIKNPPTIVNQSGLFSNAGSGDGFRFGIGKNGVYWLMGPTYAEGTVPFLSTLNSTSWYNVTAVYARSEATPQIRVYLNGIFQGSNNFNASQTAFTTGAPSMVRSPCCLNLFNGKIANFCVYNRVLTPGEIQINYNTLKTRFGI